MEDIKKTKRCRRILDESAGMHDDGLGVVAITLTSSLTPRFTSYYTIRGYTFTTLHYNTIHYAIHCTWYTPQQGNQHCHLPSPMPRVLLAIDQAAVQYLTGSQGIAFMRITLPA
ncbi:hypothetical protein MRB53_039378 [Persea americana]|nr:hypothetical protein MRB53_039378 [Persea americana]